MKEAVKELLQSLLGPYYSLFVNYFIAPGYEAVSAPWTPSENLFVVYLAAYVLIAFAVFLKSRGTNDPPSIRSFFRYLFPRKIYTHKSAILDYKFYFINNYVVKFFFAWAILGSAVLFSVPVQSALRMLFGDSPDWQPTMTSRIVYMVLAIMAVDLGGYIGHYLEHRVPLLWQFHKVHHSAEVLTPITTFRNHPVDNIVEGITKPLTVGAMTGIFAYLYPAGIMEYLIINVGVIIFFVHAVANLLHSHVWLSYGWRLNHIFYSPCMHQIHHSSEERHFDCNFAQVFSFWDYFGRTLYVPTRKEELRLGLSNNEHEAFKSIWDLYALPFKNAFELLRPPRSLAVKQREESVR